MIGSFKDRRAQAILEGRSPGKGFPSDLGSVHPGEVLREDVLEPLGMSAYVLAAHLRVPRTRIERLVREETPVTPDTALRLARYLGTTAEFWLRLQARYDLETARLDLSKDIADIKPRKAGRSARYATS